MIEFSVFGDPAAKERPRFARRGKGVTTYTPAKTGRYENSVVSSYLEVYPRIKPLAGALKMDVHVFKAVPASWSKKRKDAAIFGLERPVTRPDADNYGKLVMDALNKIAYLDDSQIVELLITKHYCKDPRVFVSITNL